MNQDAKHGLLLYPDADDPDTQEERRKIQVAIPFKTNSNLQKLEKTNSKCIPKSPYRIKST